MQYRIIKLTEVNGSFEYTHIQLIERDDFYNMRLEAEAITKGWFDGESDPEELADGVYWDECMERTISLFDVTEITKEEFDILRKYV